MFAFRIGALRSLAALAAIVASATAVSAAPLPAGKSAAGIKLIAGPKGGRILIGHEDGVSNAVAGLHAAIAAGGKYFDRPPTVESVGTSADGHAAYGAFGARLSGTPVSGIAIVALQSGGGAAVIAVFDRPAHLRTSLRGMLASLGASEPRAHADGSVAATVPARPLHEYDLPDGSASAQLPADWLVMSASQGELVARDPSRTQFAVLGTTIPITDPRAGFGARIAANSGGILIPYRSDPADAYIAFATARARRTNPTADVNVTSRTDVPSPAGRTSYVMGDESDAHGSREKFFGFVSVSPIMSMGGYNLTLTLMIGPGETMPQHVATLAAIFRSYRVNGSVRQSQTQANEDATTALARRTIDGIHATGNASMANAAASQAAIDRSTSGYVHYLNGSDVVERIGTGARASIDATFAQGLANSDPQNFRVVPMSEYRAGE